MRKQCAGTDFIQKKKKKKKTTTMKLVSDLPP